MINGHCDDRFKKIYEIFSKQLKSGHELGCSVAIEYQGKEVVNLYGGYTNKLKSKEWESNTLVNVWSVTKAVTGICISKIISDGLLDVNKNVNYYWPEYGKTKSDAKVIDILTHRAGMFGFKNGFPDCKWTDWDIFVKTLESQAPYHAPGLSQGYHALTYGWLVGEIIRRVDGRSVGTYFKEEIAEPFGIDFKIGLGDDDLSRCADILPDPRSESMILKLLPYMPDFLLPDQLKVIKGILKGGDYQVAFQSFQDQDLTNTKEWRQAEIPSANGHGTAESLAKLFGILSTGCERDGKRIFSEETLQFCLNPLSKGPDTVLFGAEINIGVGFDLGLGMTTIGQPGHPESIFGHCGIGGCVAYGDAENQLGYGFLCNRIHQPQELYKTSNAITTKLFEIVNKLNSRN